jgi:hypothetical protein
MGSGVLGWARCWVLRKRAPSFFVGWVFSPVGRLRFGVPFSGFRAWGGLFFENCIVDASILFLLF